MSLYTQYRPKDWDSVIGQDAISTVLRTSLIQGRVGHAYILTGSRGTGKTTTARILAKGVNCLNLQNGNPCHLCPHCIAFDDGNMLDCIEIDGASNNGVENVRDLIEKARFEPNIGAYKIYIIDEVHMLSTGAFNALLKTLEEPPKHVKFILATTEIDKVPETIRSRSLRFDFKKISEADIVKRLEYVCGQEGIKANTEALSIIARAARGALRDALTLTEQNTVNQEISTEYVRSTLSLIADSLIEEIISTILTADREKMTQILDTLRSRHAEVRGLFDQIMYGLRDAMMTSFQWANSTANFAEYSDIFAVFESAYTRIKIIPDGWLLIEITLMRAVARGEKSEKNIVESSEMGVRGGDTVQKFSKEKQQKEKFSSDDENRNIMSGANNWASLLTPDGFDTFATKSMENGVWKIKEDPETSSGWQAPEAQKKEQILSEDVPQEYFLSSASGHKSTEKQKKTDTKKIEDPETSSEPVQSEVWKWHDASKWQATKEEKAASASSTFSYIRLLEEVKKTKATLVLDLKTARFELKDKHLTLIFSKGWHHNRANDPAMRSIISETLETLYSGAWTIVCRLEWTPGADIADGVF